MSKILVTAFEPFGLSGKFFRHSNASQIVAERIQSALPDNYVFEFLPVSDRAEEKMQEILDREQPDGVMSLGEDFIIPSGHVRVEPYAHKKKPSVLPVLFDSPENRLVSDFVSQMNGGDRKSTIGAYFCNRVYLTALEWGQENGNVPVSFIHVPIMGDKSRHAEQVLDVVGKMETAIENTPTPGPVKHGPVKHGPPSGKGS